mmetsp:Transcript_81131/g.160798  ORF Transcript_81131/g.160798 Transcript_81131/m.160798 type:complete len:377 (+) Transcript_81131:97-1227(+)|eukprot:CAMPEP_0172902676 /NCGR_PEP_ID=MMETSP1075-20121228/168935_1 /TAXON_ID=2916 /ORGANISM="Ceratium fusus, Strain PA161109" /LENGTH=376 /DNA_ID=CAMNT_0013759321 /DNA_START=21 /DNA_END=1151 /DNA_ORIENTATION=+
MAVGVVDVANMDKSSVAASASDGDHRQSGKSSLEVFLQKEFQRAWNQLGPAQAHSLVAAVQEHCACVVVGDHLAQPVRVLDSAEVRRHMRQLGLDLAGELRRERPSWALEGSHSELCSALVQFKARKVQKVDAFETLRSIHDALRCRGMLQVTTEELEAYSKAAPVVGAKSWSREAVRWILQELGVDGAVAAEPSNQPLRLLDVGSSFGSFIGVIGVDCVALDLAPAHPQVWQADFLQLSIEDGLTAGMQSEGHRLLALASGSFDAVVLSLVLSFLPTPTLRREMLDRCRRCLRDGGSLLVVEKTALAAAGQAGAAERAAFQKAVEAAGFFTVRYAAIGQLEGSKRPHVHAWHLVTASEAHAGSGPVFKDDLPEPT